MAIPVGKWVRFVCLFVCFVFSFFISVSGRVFPITLLLSGVFVRRVFFAYFVRISGGVERRRFPWFDTVEY